MLTGFYQFKNFFNSFFKHFFFAFFRGLVGGGVVVQLQKNTTYSIYLHG